MGQRVRKAGILPFRSVIVTPSTRAKLQHGSDKGPYPELATSRILHISPCHKSQAGPSSRKAASLVVRKRSASASAWDRKRWPAGLRAVRQFGRPLALHI